MSTPNHSNFNLPCPARGSISDSRVAARWVVTERNRDSILQAEGGTRSEAWRKLCEQARTAGLSDPAHTPVGSARREWLAACLALVGAAMGWFVPLLVKGVIPGASSTLYGHVEGVLCPLLACFGGGIGFACGMMATARPASFPEAEQGNQVWRGEKSLP